ncbi:MAG: transposase [Chitinivorax sp.]
MVRGDNAFGNDALLTELEARTQPYLEQAQADEERQTLHRRPCSVNPVVDAGQGWEGQDGELTLTGWHGKRRAVVLRRALGEMLLAGQDDDGQQVLAFVEADRRAGRGITGYEYAVLVTNTDYAIVSLAQLYRDRADAENAFDELKNQWGWGGFTTHDLARCQITAQAVALIDNWWSLFVRLANPQARREAITSRPWLMSSVGAEPNTQGKPRLR